MISVLIPAFNVEAYIEKCIRAVLNQTYEELEVIVIDDGSTDQTLRILDELCQADTRLRVIHQDNTGVAGTRNRLLKEACGEWIAFVDGDDVIHSRYLELLLEAATRMNAQIAKTGYYDVTSLQAESETSGTPEVIKRESREYLLGKKDAFTLWSFLFARDLWEGITFPNCRIAEDTAVLYRILYQVEYVAELKETRLYQHLVRGDGLIGEGRFSLKMLDRLDVFQERTCFYREREDQELYRYAILAYAMELLTDYSELTRINKKEEAGDIFKRYKAIYKDAVKMAVSKKQEWLFRVAGICPLAWGWICK